LNLNDSALQIPLISLLHATTQTLLLPRKRLFNQPDLGLQIPGKCLQMKYLANTWQIPMPWRFAMHAVYHQ